MDYTQGYFTKTKIICQITTVVSCVMSFYSHSKCTISDINHLFGTFQSFEMEKLWQRYFSRCLQKLNSLKGGLNFEPKTWPKL